MTLPFLSIVTSTLNSAKTIERLFYSVLGQSSNKWEHLIVDGASSDCTIDIIHNFATGAPIKLISSEPDRSLYEAWNKALPHLSGRWTIFVGSDDYFASQDVIDELVYWDKLVQSSELDALCSVVLNDSLVPIRGARHFSSYAKWVPSALDILRGTFDTWPHPGIFYNTSLFKSGNRFDESYRIAGDVKFDILNSINRGSCFIPVQSIVHVNGGLSTRPGMNYQRFLESKKLLSELNRPRPFFSDIYYSLRSVVADKLEY